MPPLATIVNQFAVPAMMVLALVCFFTRREEVGGWLLFFFSQMYVGLAVILFGSIPIVAHAFPAEPSLARPAAGLVAVVTLLRLSAYAIVALVSTFLLRERNSVWVKRLRLALGAALFLTGIGLILDIFYFPIALVRNLMGWFVFWAWLIYFFVSVRVRMVFFSKTWGEAPVKKIFTEG